MKIKIVTVFKTNNCGSFLQAWALQEQLSKTKNSICFSNYNNGFDSFVKTIEGFVKCCLRLRFKRANSILKKYFDFSKCQKMLTISDAKESADLYFFGSDTLWNFEDDFFSKNISFFTGSEIENPCYAYSISVGSTPKDVFMKHCEALQNIKKFKSIAVRDEHTQNLLAEIYPRENLVRTIDPTMLMDKEAYLKKFSTSTHRSQKTLVIYYFGVIPENTWKALCSFAQAQGLEIVNVGLHGDRTALSVVASPANFISAFANAEYIFTNTFHGCVFSTIFNKQFATDGIDKKKIACFLEEFSLCDRVVRTADDVEMVLTTPVNYSYVNELVEEGRKRSIDYLNHCIREVKEHE